ncbi:MAG: hypothetical protein HOB84_08735 [Candidatus Marinimicrobia bacterium]|jgi:hypothetical protein|nr:hypothetical protein [Candidatus Neomarinimicrobiota bacterium]MBT4360968.1 hypothetical protein [Candidatus Neomarinimicrobiota bacterium]MBT4714845.1 hypothetical protein [Candidatus Neomarinimicrobiota bacterium]MBT4947291.1 hypothetical protein [Candidatus Neomarinimicrobiota bacterium]MBT5268198.1 hypothetical protein [Candidatus Neomarinimicrobiota bacterium]
MTETITITREQLYEKVWSQPAIAIAKELGISDVAVAKICKKLNVPKPKLGYWAKKQHGKRIRQTPLPQLKPGTPESYTIHPTQAEGLPDEAQIIIDQQQNYEKDEANKITVKETLHGAHSLVSQAYSKLKSAYTDTYNRLVFRSMGLSILVTKDSTRRALLIMDALIKALEKRGYSVSIDEGSTNVQIHDCQISFSITEKIKRIELTEGSEVKYSWEREWEYLPTGKLTLEIKERFHGQKVIRDGKTQRLEDCLNRFIILLVKSAEIMKKEKAEHQAQLIKWERERELEQLARRKRELEKLRLEQLFKSATEWQQCQLMRTYISAVRDRSNIDSDQSGTGSWLEWAEEKLIELESKFLNPELAEMESIGPKHYW